MCGLVAEAGGIGAELAGALQGNGLFVEGARLDHDPVKLEQTVVIVRDRWSFFFGNQPPVGRQELVIVDFE